MNTPAGMSESPPAPAVPASLAAAMTVALETHADGERDPVALATAAVATLRTALAAGDNRAAALPLLAADALLTAACESAAADADALQRLATHFSPHGVATLLAAELAYGDS